MYLLYVIPSLPGKLPSQGEWANRNVTESVGADRHKIRIVYGLVAFAHLENFMLLSSTWYK